ncbi:MFS general substrate transporter [Fistulina hepatica ATCC 64428]|nr:MFS general substrate transporter [Fistulina hepatica ATCC 64428]
MSVNSATDCEKNATTVSDTASSVGVAKHGIDEHKLMRKIDLHVLPYICVMYLLAFLDRVNISNATLFGLKEDLGLVGTQYNTVLVIFFVPYILCEIPSDVLLKRFRPHVCLSVCMTMFGLVSMLQGFTHNFGGLVACRWFLGMFESGMFPGCFYLLAMWYRRGESQKRYTFFFCSTTLAGAFGGLLASAIGQMQGLRGYRGWRWVFIIEGIVTCVLGIAWYFFLPDFPEESKFLTPEEREFVKERLRADVGSSAHAVHFTYRDTLSVVKDYKIWLGGLMYMGTVCPAYGYAYFAPTIINSFGYSTIQSQLYSVPPWACAFGMAMIIAYASDRLRHRWAFAVFGAVVCIAGFAVLVTYPSSVHVKYGMLFLAASGAYSSMPVQVCWFNTNLAGHLRRQTGSAFQVAFGNVGGIIAAYAFPSTDGPRYTKGYGICLGFMCLTVLSCTAYLIGINIENRQRVHAHPKPLNDEDKERLGDLNPDYRYLS